MNFENAMKEIESFKASNEQGFFTEQQKQFVLSARDAGMSFKKITDLWNKIDGWKKVSKTTIADRFNDIKPKDQSD